MGPPKLGAVRVVAVDGPSGSGKSTYAVELARKLPGRVRVVRTDDFATWDDPVAWWPRLRDGVLLPLAEGRPGRYRRTEWTEGRPHPGAWVDVEPPDVLIVEGVSAGRRAITPVLSALVWIEVDDPAVRLERAVARDGESCRPELIAWQRFEAGWFAVDGTRDRATHRPLTG
ncbi:uridine kinase [Actinokineospora sp. UTMC 2448]|uniref:uridine kinase family protein n=1 Tax=Actinokineospora sp. UTMC 2448 TaxID=2268449 RepID=UPI0021648F9C|nr:(d)CMP kinase [Actinokineospora sp. UTMC 2448]UVS76544.1 uridine kinase [Actinokineospora sp. UTMC 2448]